MLSKSSGILLFTLALSGVVLSQDIKFDRLTERDGLSHSGIICIIQDQQGYMWVGTRNGGLHKYDGYNFTVYQHDPEDVTSISSNWIESLFVDHAGVLWVGTNGKGGLNRYDSHTDSFVRYHHESDNVNSLIDDRIQVVYEAPSEPGILWVGTELGLVRFDTKTGKMISYTNDPENDQSLSYNHVRAIYEDRNGTLWIGTGGYALEHEGKGGLNRFDRESGVFKRYLHDPSDDHSLIDNRVDVIYEDSKDNFWVGTRGDGLHQFDELNEKFKRFSLKSNPDALPTKPHLLIRKEDPYEGVSFIREDRWGQLWIGGWKGGLNQYDSVSKKQNHYERDPQNPNSLIDNNVLCAYEDRQGTLWVGTWSGLHKVVRKRLHFDVYEHDPLDQNSLSVGNTLSLTQDRKGRIWIPMYSGGVGVEMLDPITGIFTHFRKNSHGLSSDSIRVIFQDIQGTMWLGTEGGGLNRYDELTDTFIHYRHIPSDESSIVNDTVLAITEGAPGALWIGTKQGISQFDVNRNTFYNYPVGLNEAYSPGNKSVTEIHVDKSGYIWFATESGGVHKLDPSLGTITEHQFNDESSRIGLREFQSEIHEDKAGAIWVGRRIILNSERAEFLHLSPKNSPLNGFYRYEPTNNSFTPILPETSIRVIYEGRDGSLWLATNEGLYSVNHENGEINHFTTVDGLVSNEVYSILEDDLGILWIGTESGLSRFDSRLGSFSSFYREDGIPRRIFRQDGGLVSMDGMLYFGLVDNSEGALISFNPLHNSINTIPPELVFTSLRVSNTLVEPGPRSPLQEPITNASKIILGPQEQSFSIEFSALHFQMPKENTYKYILEGYEEDWIDSGTIRLARYSHVTPGTYSFMVKAANSEGVWSDEINSIDVVILPPWWQTGWAYISYGLALVLGLILSWQALHRRYLRLERERTLALEVEQARVIESKNQLLIVQQQQLEEQKKMLASRNELLEQQKEKLLQLDTTKSRFFANISHEFRTPLTLILGPLEKRIQGAKNSDQRRELSMMQRQAQRLLYLINQLLDLSLVDSGKLSLKLKRLDLVSEMNKLVDAFSHKAEQENISLSFQSAINCAEVIADPDKAEHIFMNLLSNAFKFTLPGGEIRLGLEAVRNEDSNFFEFSISDTGRGIQKDELPYIFDRFYQVDSSATRKYEGSGIGLSLVKELVELHGWQIVVASDIGVGSTFSIRMKRADTYILENDQFVDAMEEMPTNGHSFRSITSNKENAVEIEVASQSAPEVLIVEDNSDVREYLRSHLARQYRIAEAVDGEKGLERMRSHPPALVIADVMMPHMDGMALCKAIKLDSSLNTIPVILLTARAEEEDRLEGLGIGADDYITKPFSLDELIVRVENLIEVRNVLREHYSSELIFQPGDVVLSSDDAAFIERMKQIIEAEMASSSFTVDTLSATMGMSARQLHRRAKTVTGLTPGVMIRTMRLHRAANMLEQQAGRVSEIAYKVGFNDVRNFSRVFRQVYGVNPSEYRT